MEKKTQKWVAGWVQGIHDPERALKEPSSDLQKWPSPGASPSGARHPWPEVTFRRWEVITCVLPQGVQFPTRSRAKKNKGQNCK